MLRTLSPTSPRPLPDLSQRERRWERAGVRVDKVKA
jgi:hypothetical protein